MLSGETAVAAVTEFVVSASGIPTPKCRRHDEKGNTSVILWALATVLNFINVYP